MRRGKCKADLHKNGEMKMPLLPGKKNIGHNIKEEEKAGKGKAQSIAIALNVARKSGAKIPKSKKGKK